MRKLFFGLAFMLAGTLSFAEVLNHKNSEDIMLEELFNLEEHCATVTDAIADRYDLGQEATAQVYFNCMGY